MNSKGMTSVFALLAVFSLVLLAGCKALGLSEPEVEVELSQSFTSERFGYSISVPEGWIFDEDTAGQWLDFLPASNTGTGGIDHINAYQDGRNLAMAIGARSTAIDGSDVAAVEERLRGMLTGAQAENFVCQDLEVETAGASEPITIAGEEGVLIPVNCTTPEDGFFIVALVVHNDQVYWFTWAATPGDTAADFALFEEILGTVEFTS